MSLNRSEVWGNATLFDGSSIDTQKASSDAMLANGVRIQFGVQSRATVWRNRTALDKGVAQVIARAPYEIDAGGIKVKADTGSRMILKVGAQVEVTALAGVAQVRDREGTLLASIAPGRTLSFAFQTAVTRTGCLLYKDAHFILQDENTNEVFELYGPNLEPNTGDRVEITGTAATTKPALSVATAVMNVATVTVKTTGGCLSVASTLNANTEAPQNATTPKASGGSPPASTAPKSGGMSTGAKIAIVAAVAGGGAGAALALAGHKSSTSP